MLNPTVHAAATGLPTRRTAITSLGSLCAAVSLPILAKSAPLAGDIIPALFAEKTRVDDLVNSRHYASEDEADALMDRWNACDIEAIANPATTKAGAIASIDWVLTELKRFGFDGSKPNIGTDLVLSLLDGALGALRASGGAA